nr:hypothetical protein Iba_chr04aCG11000 [Ipomoea batatas]
MAKKWRNCQQLFEEIPTHMEKLASNHLSFCSLSKKLTQNPSQCSWAAPLPSFFPSKFPILKYVAKERGDGNSFLVGMNPRGPLAAIFSRRASTSQDMLFPMYSAPENTADIARGSSPVGEFKVKRRNSSKVIEGTRIT